MIDCILLYTYQVFVRQHERGILSMFRTNTSSIRSFFLCQTRELIKRCIQLDKFDSNRLLFLYHLENLYCLWLLMDINENKMNSTSTCLYNESTCYFIDGNNNCLSDDIVLDMISKLVVPTYHEWICIILYVIVFIVGTIGNLLVIIVIQRNRSMR